MLKIRLKAITYDSIVFAIALSVPLIIIIFATFSFNEVQAQTQVQETNLTLKDSETRARIENVILRIQLLQVQMDSQQKLLPELKAKAFKEMNLKEEEYELDFTTLTFKKKS